MNTEKFEGEGWRTFMARYRRSDGHYADVECAYVELERYLVLSCKAGLRGSDERGSLLQGLFGLDWRTGD
jgi:hypothetical protein